MREYSITLPKGSPEQHKHQLGSDTSRILRSKINVRGLCKILILHVELSPILQLCEQDWSNSIDLVTQAYIRGVGTPHIWLINHEDII